MMQEERMREYREMQVRQFRKMSKAFLPSEAALFNH